MTVTRGAEATSSSVIMRPRMHGRSESSGVVATHGRDSRHARIRRIIRLPDNLEIRT